MKAPEENVSEWLSDLEIGKIFLIIKAKEEPPQKGGHSLQFTVKEIQGEKS